MHALLVRPSTHLHKDKSTSPTHPPLCLPPATKSNIPFPLALLPVRQLPTSTKSKIPLSRAYLSLPPHPHPPIRCGPTSTKSKTPLPCTCLSFPCSSPFVHLPICLSTLFVYPSAFVVLPSAKQTCVCDGWTKGGRSLL